MKIILKPLACLVACALGAIFIYALVALAYILSQEGMVNRPLLALRNGLIAIAAGAATWLLLKRAASQGRPGIWLPFIVAVLASSLLALYVYGFYCHTKNLEEQWSELQSVANELKSREGTAASDLLSSEYFSVVTRQPMGSDREQLRIALNNSFAGQLFGVDVFQFDVIVVDVAPDGSIERVRVDYF